MSTRVALIGTGLIGRAWAIAFARGGHDVVLYNRSSEGVVRAVGFIESVLGDLARFGLLGGATPEVVRARMSTANDLGEAVDDADYIQESVQEDLALKKSVFAELDRQAPPWAPIGSSASALMPSLLFPDLRTRERFIVAHPTNPPYLVPAVEIVPSPWTAPEVTEYVHSLMVTIGQAPLTMKRELDGFVMNRLQGALLQEAFRLVAEGYATPEAVDIGLRRGLGLRWAIMGPFETIDLNAPKGIREYIERYEPVFKRLWQTQDHVVPWSGELAEQLEKQRAAVLPRDQLSARQAWRDRRLMALLAHLQAAERDVAWEQTARPGQPEKRNPSGTGNS
jgi:3-hydroxyacyl-CoA dehydrogenase